MMLTLAYGYGTPQRIEAPFRDGVYGVPAGEITLTVYDEAGTLKKTDTASKGSFTSTVATAVAAGSRSVVVAAVTGLTRNEPFALYQGTSSSTSRTELCWADSIDADAVTKTITLRDRLIRSYEVGHLAVSSRVYYSIDLSDTATWPHGYYLALFDAFPWRPALAAMFRIVDQPVDNPIAFTHVRSWLPHASALRDAFDDPELQSAREAAWQLLKDRVRASGRDPEVWRDASRIALAGGLLAAAIFLLSRGQIDLAHELAGDPVGTGGIFIGHWNDLVRAPGWFDSDQNKAMTWEEVKRPVTRTLGRSL